MAWAYDHRDQATPVEVMFTCFVIVITLVALFWLRSLWLSGHHRAGRTA